MRLTFFYLQVNHPNLEAELLNQTLHFFLASSHSRVRRLQSLKSALTLIDVRIYLYAYTPSQ